MHYETHKLSLPGSADYARFTTYFLEVSKEIPCGLRPTVIVCPGGGYGMTSDREAEPIALSYSAAGINTVVVRYSVAPARFPTALLELATVVRYVREHGPEFGCDPNRIFVTGFSAGGHLAASYGNFWSRSFIAETLGCDSEVLRPNGQILCYPVITSGEYAHHGSFKNLLGDDYEAEKANHSLENFVSSDTPPTFIWHTQSDNAVPIENSIFLLNALQKNGIKTEFHMYPEGVHGLSLCNEITGQRPEMIVPHAAGWIDLAIEFVKSF